MNVLYKIVTFLITIIFVGCRGNCETDSLKFKNIQIDVAQKQLDNHFTYESAAELIVLKSASAKDLIGNVYNVRFNNDLLYVYDDHQRKIVVYNLKGEPLKVLYRKGRGPGEYQTISSWCIDRDGNLTLVDNRSNKVILYDNDFNCIKEMNVDYDIEAIEELSSDKYILGLAPYNTKCYKSMQLIVVNKEFKVECVVKHYDKIDENYLFGRTNLIKSGDKILYHRPIDDYAYAVNPENNISDLYQFTYEGGKTIPAEYRLDIDYYMTNEMMSSYTSITNCIMINSKHSFGHFFDKMEYKQFYIDMQGHTHISSLWDNICGRFVGGTDSILISTIDALDILENKGQSAQLATILKEDDIILCLYNARDICQ